MALKLIITVDDAGKMHLEGPLTNRLLCYGMLEEAKNVIRDFVPEQQKLVQPVLAGIPLPQKNGKVF